MHPRLPQLQTRSCQWLRHTLNCGLPSLARPRHHPHQQHREQRQHLPPPIRLPPRLPHLPHSRRIMHLPLHGCMPWWLRQLLKPPSDSWCFVQPSATSWPQPNQCTALFFVYSMNMWSTATLLGFTPVTSLKQAVRSTCIPTDFFASNLTVSTINYATPLKDCTDCGTWVFGD
jgi:hypothetical protein